jgi:hypothetical protein
MRNDRATDDARQTDAAMSYADRVLYEAQVSATRGLDLDRAAGVVTDLVAGIEKMAAALRGADYATRMVACPACKVKHAVPAPDPDLVARALAHAMKSADSLVRLQEFAAGRPDSRPDTGTAWLQALTNEQLAIVSGWIEANGQRAAGRD